MEKCIKNFIKHFDFFPETFEFNVNGKGKKKSVFGGLISFLVIVGVFLLTFFNIYSYLNYRQASIISEIQYTNNLPMNLTNDQLEMLLSLWDVSKLKPLNLVVNNSTIGLTDIDVKKTLSNDTSSVNIVQGNFVRCSNNNSANNLYKYLVDNMSMRTFIDNFLCDNINPTTVLLGGNLMNGRKISLDIVLPIDLCQIDSSINCTDKLPFKGMNPSYTLFYRDNYLNSSDKNGFTNTTNNYFFPIIYNQISNIQFYMVLNEIITYDNLFFNYPSQNKTYFTYESFQFSTTPNITNSTTLFVNIHVEIPIYKRVITRIYPKIDSVFAGINAFSLIIVFIAKLIIQVCNYGNIDFHLMRNLYYIDDPDIYDEKSKVFFKKKFGNQFDKIRRISLNKISQPDKDIKINPNKNKKGLVIREEDNYEMDDIDNYLEKTKYNYLKKFLKGRHFEKNRLKWIFYICCPKSNYDISIEYFMSGKAMLMHDLNILVILKKLINIEKIYTLLFDDYELETMNGLQNRVIFKKMKPQESIANYQKILLNKGSSKVSINNFFNGYMKCFNSKGNLSKKIIKEMKFEF